MIFGVNIPDTTCLT